MEETMVLTTINIALGIILSMGVYIWKKQDKRIENCEGNEKEIKTNYVSRLDDIKTNNNSEHTEIKVTLSEIKTSLNYLAEDIKELKNR